MTIQPIGAGSVALYLTPDDLQEHGLTPESLTRELALALTRRAFLDSGMPADGPMEIEAYPDPCGVLVFARLGTSGALWFAFENIENLIAAARCFPDGPPDAALSLCDGKYWLSLPEGETHAACRMLEFGSAVSASPLFDARLAEYGVALLSGKAFHHLLQFFPN